MSTTAKWISHPHRFAQISASIRLHYVDSGRPKDCSVEQPPVVLLHGWPDFSFGWRHQFEPLAAEHRVIVPDMRGFGQSSTPKEESAYGSKNITDDLAKLLDILEIEKAIFVGHDWGATMGWRMCLYQPHRVAAVCSVCIPFYPPADVCTDIDALATMMTQFAYLKLLADSERTAAKLDKAPRRFYNAVFHHSANIPGDLKDLIDGLEDGDDAKYTEPSTLLSSDELEYYVSQHKGFLGGCRYYGQWQRDFDTERELAREIPHPALYIATTQGTEDDPMQQETVASMAAVIPQLETQVLHETGHWALWQKKGQATAMLLEWLARVK